MGEPEPGPAPPPAGPAPAADPSAPVGGPTQTAPVRGAPPAAPGGGPPPATPADGAPPAILVEEAVKKAAVAWITVPGRAPLALWCLPLEGRLYVVSGPGEQAAPGLAKAGAVRVTLRGDHGGRIVTWPAAVTRIMPETEEWLAVTPQLAAKRLNAPGPTERLIDRWAAECSVHRLAPSGDPVEAGPTLPDSAQSEPPRENSAVRVTRRPFRLHRVRRRDPSS
jgi:hypothetical protein